MLFPGGIIYFGLLVSIHIFEMSTGAAGRPLFFFTIIAFMTLRL